MRIGRAYSNDIILDDPFVSPNHVRIDIDSEGTLVATDLDSRNGLFHERSSRRDQTLTIRDGTGFRIGHTVVRYRSSDHEVPDALTDWSTWGVLGVLQNRHVSSLLLMLASLAWVADEHLRGWEAVKTEGLVYEFMIATGVLAVCASLWALLSKLLTHRFNFSVHVGIVSAATVIAFLYPLVLEHSGFALDADDLAYWAGWLIGTALTFVWLLAHLRYACAVATRRLVWVAAGMALSLTIAFGLGGLVDASGFSEDPVLDASLKPPSYLVAEGRSTDGFLDDLSELRVRVDRAACEGNSRPRSCSD